MSPHINS